MFNKYNNNGVQFFQFQYISFESFQCISFEHFQQAWWFKDDAYNYFRLMYSETRSQCQSKLAQQYFLKNTTQQQDFSVYEDEGGIGNEPLMAVKEHQMKQKMHKNIVAVYCKDRSGHSVKGSGLLVSNNIVLTCAHILCKKAVYGVRQKFKPQQIEIYHAPCGIINKPLKVQNYAFPIQILNSQSQRSIYWDFALIKLKQSINADADDFMSLKVIQQFEQNAKIAVFGYSNCSYTYTLEGVEQVSQRGSIKQNAILTIRKQKDEIVHNLTTAPGHSGSPIMLLKGEQCFVIGIHKGETFTKIGHQHISANSSKYLSRKLIDHLIGLTKKIEGKPFYTYKMSKQPSIPPTHTGPSQLTIPQSQCNFQAKMGDAYFQQKLYEKAIVFYKKAIQSQAKAEFFYKIGLTYFTLKKYKQSIEYYKQAIKRDPNNPTYYNNLANALDAYDQKMEAIETYRKAIKVDPNCSMAYFNLGLTIQSFKDVDSIRQAAKMYRKTIQLNKEECVKGYRNLGLALIKLKQKKQALQYLQKYLTFKPKDWEEIKIVVDKLVISKISQ